MLNWDMQKGFSEVVALITVLVLIAVGGAYYFGTQKNRTAIVSSPSPVAPTSPTQMLSPTPTAVDQTASWKVFTSQSLGFRIKYPPDTGYTIKEESTCMTVGVPETDNGFSVCRYELNGRNLEQLLKQETVSSNPNCQGLYGTCGETALNYEDLKFTNMTINNYKVIKVEQTEASFKIKYNVIRTPKVYIFTNDNAKIFEIGGVYNDKILSTFKFTE